MAQITSVLRSLAENRLGEPILAMAQFRAAPPDANPLNLFVLADLIHRRRSARLPNPAFLAVGKTAVHVFSARFGTRIRLIGPLDRWSRSDLTATRSSGRYLRMIVQISPDRPRVELEAVDPDADADKVIELCTTPLGNAGVPE